MFRLFLLVCLAFGAWQLYHKGVFNSGSSGMGKDGKAQVVLVVGPGCGDACDSIRSLLGARGLAFEEINVAGPDGAPVENRFGINGFPTTLIGKVRVQGNDLPRITAALAETFGDSALSEAERRAMMGHFDDKGRPKVVLYGTSWCGYCKAQRALLAEKNIHFDDLDVESSEAAKMAYTALKGNGYPLVYVGYRRFSGFQDAALLAAIGELIQ